MMSCNSREARVWEWMLAGVFLVFTAPTDPNRAPAVVFIGLGVALVIVLIVLLLTIPISGEDYRGFYGGFGGGSPWGGGGFGGF